MNKHVALLIVAILIAFCLAMVIGSVNIFTTNPNIVTSIVVNIRLPRIILALVVGMALVMSGWIFQVLLKNPMADSFTLGMANAAVLGSAITTLLGLPLLIRPVLSISLGLLSLLLVLLFTYSIDRHYRSDTLIISGILLGAIMSGMLYVILLVEPSHTESIARYMFGSMNGATMTQAVIVGVLTIIVFVIVYRKSDDIERMMLGDIRAHSLGVKPKRLRPLLILVASIPPLVAISYTGIIALVGIVIPQMILYLKPMRFKEVLIFGVLYGGLFMVIVDTVGRSIIAPIQIPAGVVVMLLALPLLLFLLKSKRHITR